MRVIGLAGLAAICMLPARSATPTFHKDVQPILQKHCQACHRVGEAAPMPLTTYAEVRPWAKSIRAKVLSGEMPPWHADPKYGKFRNDISLSAHDKETLIGWIDSGAEAGRSADAPKPAVSAPGWNIPAPDVVFEMPADFTIPANGAVDYQFIRVPTHFAEDRWVQMAEVRPGNRTVVHHAIVVVLDSHYRDDDYLAGYAPGMSPQIWKPGQARLVKAGSVLEFQMHYTANGRPATDRTRIGLVFAKTAPKERIMAMQASYPLLVLPPGEPNIRVAAAVTMTQEVRLMGMRPHMHLRGKSFLYRAVYPTGEVETLLHVPNFNFDYQPYYYLETPKLLPKGTRIECAAIYDNSPNNPRNPDPNDTVTWGPQTWNEMMIGWLDVGLPAQ